jgi:hypothetical protein
VTGGTLPIIIAGVPIVPGAPMVMVAGVVGAAPVLGAAAPPAAGVLGGVVVGGVLVVGGLLTVVADVAPDPAAAGVVALVPVVEPCWPESSLLHAAATTQSSAAQRALRSDHPRASPEHWGVRSRIAHTSAR